ncbi:MAG: ligase-associated DNA damage response DEXH box helicase [Siculibacillus sp.]
MIASPAPLEPPLLPDRFVAWFAMRGWQPRPHQLALLDHARRQRSTLLIAPTGAGKTLAGFLPSLVALSEPGGRRQMRITGRGVRRRGIHTLYISPLKALAVDVARNVEKPIAEMGLDIRVETRTGDTSTHKRQRQKIDPPDILMTTPEQVALLISGAEAEDLFDDLDTIVLDELHALVTSKRGDLLALGLARLRRLAPHVRLVGLSATVANPGELAGWLTSAESPAEIVTASGGARPDLGLLISDARIPWAGHMAGFAMADVYTALKSARMALVFVNTRAQAEFTFQELWRLNEDTLPIALHHGSLDAGQRRKVEAAMADGRLKAVVCTSTLDLGIDWGDVDLVIQIGAPKGASRLAQRIGRANHRLDEPSRALLVPASRFEVMECRAAVDAANEGHQDTPPIRAGSLDVLAQHVLGMACAGPFRADELFAEVRSAWPYRDLDRERFDRVVDFVATGGYALKSYERFAKIRLAADGGWRLSHPRFAQQYRLNIGTIIEMPMLNVVLTSRNKLGRVGVSGRRLGQIEEYFLETLSAGDTFRFAGEVLRFETIRDSEALVTRAHDPDPKVPAYAGGKFPLSTYLAERVRAILADLAQWRALPDQVAEWLAIQREVSLIPRADQLLVETFPRANRWYMVCYPFEGRLAHQTLGMLLTRRMERLKLKPMGFVASEYALGIWLGADIGASLRFGRTSLDALFDEDMLGDDLEAWMAESHLLKRTFRNCAVIAGLIERRYPGQEKSGRQVTVSTDLVYDVLRSHEPDHILLQATWADASAGLLDIGRLAAMLKRVRGRIVYKPLERISPLAVPVMLEVDRQPVAGATHEALLGEAEDEIIREAMGDRASRFRAGAL